MNRSQLVGIVAVLGLIFGGYWTQRRAQQNLAAEMKATQAALTELAARVADQQEAWQRLSDELEKTRRLNSASDESSEARRLRSDLANLNRRLEKLEAASLPAKLSPEPLVYADSIRRADYAFGGYDSPESAMQSVLWAITQLNPRAFWDSLTGNVAASFADSFKDLPEGVMPGGFKNGAMYRATGFRILEEAPVSEDEVRLKVFLEGQNHILKLVLKKVSGQWKWADNQL
ncbi:MAG TPA: hypothetical protein PLX89_25965 [Verrucomicrobiota bacterium]|nr:hypothetical protein [Verrucomicrobiales bacterium]HRI16455.1 hypothetical protein [Verrucomicrobiota bacterium]